MEGWKEGAVPPPRSILGLYKCHKAKLVSSGHGVLLCVLQFISFSWPSFPWALPAQGIYQAPAGIY